MGPLAAPKFGTVGDTTADGWCEWSTVDDSWSYEPTIACGHFLIFVGKGDNWGAPSDGHGRAAIIDLEKADDPYADDLEVGGEDFVWSLDPFLAAVTKIAEQMEHPAPANVVGAARDLWFALMQRDAFQQGDTKL